MKGDQLVTCVLRGMAKENVSMSNDDLVTVAKAAEITNYSPRTVQHLLSRKIVLGRKVARDWLVDLSSLQEYKKVFGRGVPRLFKQNRRKFENVASKRI